MLRVVFLLRVWKGMLVDGIFDEMMMDIVGVG